jgi:hypothetical protein
MNTSSHELLDVLATVTTSDFARAVALARRLVMINGVSISRNETGVPTGDLREVYADRASSPFLPKVHKRQYEEIVRLAAQYPFERWYIISIDIGFYGVVVFANEQGVGRYCLDRTNHGIIVAIQPNWDMSSISRYLDDEYQESGDVKLLEGVLIVSTSAEGFLNIEERDEYRSNPALHEEFRRDVGHLRLFRVIFNDIDPVRRLLRRLSEAVVQTHERAWIDTTYQSVISAQDFLVRSDADPDWDWITFPSSPLIS